MVMSEPYKPAEYFRDVDLDRSSEPIRDYPPNIQRYALSIFPTEMNFGNIKNGQTSYPYPAVLVNSGWDDIAISEIIIVGKFTLSTVINDLPVVIKRGEMLNISATFNPNGLGAFTGGLYINTGDATGKEFIKLLGSGIA